MLHLKAWYAQPGDQLESKVDGYVIDLVRGDLLVEVQTANFSAIKRKLVKLLENHPVRLVYPIPSEKWILRISRGWCYRTRKAEITQTRAGKRYISGIGTHPEVDCSTPTFHWK